MENSNAYARRWALPALLVACALLLFHGYAPVLHTPGAVLFATDGDGLKNYYTFLYHIRYDHDPWEFRGMDHPYGEHVLFTDGHPLLSILIMALRPVCPWLPLHGVAIINLLMVLALPLCAVVLHRLMRELGASPWTAAAAAFGIMVLAPQVDRLYGHLALSYSVFLPLTWLLLLRAMRTRRWWVWALLLFGSSVWWWGTHAYLGAMASGFGACYLIGIGLQRWKTMHKADRWRTAVLFLCVCVLPLALFESAMLTDHHVGRSAHPSGFFGYTAEPDDLLFPIHPPLYPFWQDITNNGLSLQWEASAYLGLAVIFILLAWPIVALRERITKVPRRPLAPEVRAAIWASGLLLLFAFCFPFKDLPGLLKWFPLFEQFRATGRFDWPFYFVITITAVLLLDGWMRSWRPGVKAAALIAMTSLMTWEGIEPHSRKYLLEERPNIFDREALTAEEERAYGRLSSADYQAIVPLPYFNFGSEAFTRPPLGNIMRCALPLSYRTGIPLMAGILSRTSVPESKKLTAIISPRYFPKAIEADLPDERPFLIVRGDAPLGTCEQEILNDARLLDSLPGMRLYAITRKALFRQVNGERWSTFEKQRPSLKERHGFLVADTTGFMAFLDMDTLPSDIVFRGKGAYTAPKLGRHVIARMRLAGVKKGTPMMVGAWFYNAFPEGLTSGLELRVAEADGWEFAWGDPNEAATVEGDWSLFELPFEPFKDDMEIEIFTTCSGHLERTLIVDDVLVRPRALDVHRVDRGPDGKAELFLNDQRIPEP